MMRDVCMDLEFAFLVGLFDALDLAFLLGLG